MQTKKVINQETANGSTPLTVATEPCRSVSPERSGSGELAEPRRAKHLLYSEMSRISENCWHAGWMDGLEFALWELLLGGSRNYGMEEIAERDVTTLKELSQVCGGWYYWQEGANDAAFVSLAEWETIYHSRAVGERSLSNPRKVNL